MKKSTGQIFTASLLYLVIFLVGYFSTEEKGENWRLVALVIITCHIYLSAIIINEKQLGAMFAFGREVCDLESGFNFAFWPFCYVRRETKNIVQLEIGVLTEEEKKKAITLKSSDSVYLLEDPFYLNWG